MAVKMTLEEARANAQGWRELLTEATERYRKSQPHTRERSQAWRDISDATAALEWYEGHYELLPGKKRELLKAQRAEHKEMLEAGLKIEPKLNGKVFTVFDMDGVTKKDCKFVPGKIQQLVGEAERLKDESNLGVRFEGRTFATFNKSRNPKAFEEAVEYANKEILFKNPNNCLLILGSTGTGKTHLAAAIANSLINQAVPTRFGTFQTHLENIKKDFEKDKKSEQLDRIKGTPMLVIDDLGQERKTDWTQSILYDVVNYRYEHQLPMVITSNLNATGMANHCGTAVWSRLNEISNTIIMTGEDYRMGK